MYRELVYYTKMIMQRTGVVTLKYIVLITIKIDFSKSIVFFNHGHIFTCTFYDY